MFFTIYNARTIFLVISEMIFICLIFVATSINGMFAQSSGLSLYLGKALSAAAIIQASFYLHDLYDLNTFNNRLVRRTISSLLLASVIIIPVYWFFPSLKLTPVLWFFSAVLVLSLSYSWRILVKILDKPFRSSMLIIGTSDMAISIAEEIRNRPALGIQVYGFLGEDRSMSRKTITDISILGTLEDLESLVARYKIDHILVTLQDRRGHLPVKRLLDLKLQGVAIEEGASFFERILGKLPVEELNPSYLVFSTGFKVSRLKLIYKRIFSIIFSIIGLIISAPVMLLTAIAIKLESPGPILFLQERVGEEGRIFKLIKFRSMYVDAEAHTGPVWARTNDPRITRVGRFIRRMRIDELPQFINVLKGDMHFVGPRPERSYFVKQLEKIIPYYGQRHTVKPGITGWAQIKYPYGATIEEACEKLKYDLYYIKNLSLPLDLWIIFQTIKIVLVGRGAR
ncbi:MAG: TIGR03013 family XrtA/PEP-CTERM system glycosyltransferase [Acidobacteriota bacterium]